jgi:transposase
MAIVEAIAEGKKDRDYLISLLKGKAKKKADLMKEALDGRITLHHQKMIRFYLDDYKHNENQINSIENELTMLLEPNKQQKIESLQKIDGIGKHAAEVIIAELGDDMSYFPSADHAASWSGLSPGNAESAGKSRYTKVRQGNPYLRVIMVQVAWAASRTKNTYWYAAYRALCNRLPKKKAIIAIARKLLKVVYKTLKNGYEYQKWTINDFFEIKKGRRDLGIKTC